jgi:hypothetical protein
MSHTTSKRGRPWRVGLALVLVCTCLPLLAFASSANAAYALFCPAGGGTITLGAWAGCTNGVANALTIITFSNPSAPFHCAVGKASSDPNGASSNVTLAACATGSVGSGDVTSLGSAGGTWGYARGTNEQAFAVREYWGSKQY